MFQGSIDYYRLYTKDANLAYRYRLQSASPAVTMFNMKSELNQFPVPAETSEGGMHPPSCVNNNDALTRVSEQKYNTAGAGLFSCPSCGQAIERAIVARALGAEGGRKSRRKLSPAEIQALKDARARKRASIPREAF